MDGWARHLEVETGVGRGDRAARAEPVRHHRAVPTPLVAQDRREQPGVLGAVGAVEPVVRGHEHPTAGLGRRRLERGKVDLAEGPLWHVGADRHALELRVVAHEVLDRGAHAAALDATDERHGHARGQVRVLGVALERAAGEGCAVDVDGRRQQHVGSLAAGLVAQLDADVAHELGVPRGGQRRATREARRARPTGPLLAARPVGPVGHLQGGDPQTRHRRCVPEVGAGDEAHLLLQRQLPEELLDAIAHRRHPNPASR